MKGGEERQKVKSGTLEIEAWRFGLKSTYYLRSQSPEAIAAEDGVEDRSMECVGCQ